MASADLSRKAGTDDGMGIRLLLSSLPIWSWRDILSSIK